VIEVDLVEVRGDYLFSQFMRLRAQERNPQTGEGGDQRLRQPIRAAATVGLERLYLAQRCGDHEQAVGILGKRVRDLRQGLDWEGDTCFAEDLRDSQVPATTC